MASTIPDHYLWLGLGVFTFFAIKQVSVGLHHIRHLTHIHNLPVHTPPPSIYSPNPADLEAAIKNASLLTLASSHNTDIRASATKILCNRFYASKAARKLLLRDLKSKDDEVRHRAQLALNMLCEMGVWRDGAVPPKTARGAWRVAGRREDGGAEERDLRRRRREAVVIHEGDGAIGRDDVYMRDEDGRIGAGVERRGIEELLEALSHLG